MLYKTQLAVLITCHNRKSKTLACLDSLFKAYVPMEISQLDVYLVDDGSTDGTAEAITNKYPLVKVIQGTGALFWAGGMRLAWRTALCTKNYDAFLLINDDVILDTLFLSKLLETDNFSIETTGIKGIYSGATFDTNTERITYGGHRILINNVILKMKKILPSDLPQFCDMTNANILWVSHETVDRIGIFNDKFTHGIADFDYSLRARKNKIPVLLAPGVCGRCTDDHGPNWSCNSSFKERIGYLRSPKGLAYKEYFFYIRRHFPLYFPYAFVMLWLKTIYPSIWTKYKKN